MSALFWFMVKTCGLKGMGVWSHVPTFSDQSGKSLVLVFLVVVRIGALKARGGGVVGGVVVVDCTVTWSDDELHKVSGPW